MTTEFSNESSHYTGEAHDGYQLATAWARYWSRFLDLSLGLISAGFLFGFLFPQTFLELLDKVGGNDYALYIIFIPVVFLAEALCLGVVGQTLGRAIAGIKLQKKSGEQLSVGEAMSRSLQVYVKGLGLGLPLVSLITLINAHGKVKAGQETSWDERADTRVIADGASLGRTFLTAFFYVIIVFALNIWDKVSQSTLDSEMPSQTSSLNSDPVEDQLRTGALELKASLPKDLDPITKLIDIEVNGRVLTYVHEISRRDVSDAALQSYLDTTKLAEVCQNKDSRTLIDDFEVTYEYRYFMPNSDTPLTLAVDRAACAATT